MHRVDPGETRRVLHQYHGDNPRKCNSKTSAEHALKYLTRAETFVFSDGLRTIGPLNRLATSLRQPNAGLDAGLGIKVLQHAKDGFALHLRRTEYEGQDLEFDSQIKQ